jgi:hypothetical protein
VRNAGRNLWGLMRMMIVINYTLKRRKNEA